MSKSQRKHLYPLTAQTLDEAWAVVAGHETKQTRQSPLELLDANAVSWILEMKRPAGRYWTLKRLTDGSASEIAASQYDSLSENQGSALPAPKPDGFTYRKGSENGVDWARVRVRKVAVGQICLGSPRPYKLRPRRSIGGALVTS